MKRYIPILIMAISIAVTSCNNLLVKEEPTTQEEKARVSLAVGSSNSRTILPEAYDEVASLKNFTFTATGTTGAEVTHTFTDYDTLQTAQLFFTPDTYDCSLSVISAAGVKYEGVLEDKVIEPGDNLLAFKLQIVQLSTEPGTLEVQLTFPGEKVQMVKAGLYSIAGEVLSGFSEKVLEITDGNTVTYSKDRVPGGNHLVQFSFYGDDEGTVFLGMHTEVIVIVSGKKSAATRNIESINPMYIIIYELNGGAFVEGYAEPDKFTPNMEIQLPTMFEVSKDNNCFLGWYEDADFSGTPVNSILRGTGENKTYYAKWALGKIVTASTVENLDLSSTSGEYRVVVTGEITSSTISTLKTKLTAAGESAQIHLDLSQTTGLTSIGISAFYGCSGLTSVEIPAGVTSIGASAFSECGGLTSVEIPAGVTSIGKSAFSGCGGLTSVEIPAGVTSIGNTAFYGCSGLTSVEIPAGVTSIGNSAFEGCKRLTSVEIPASVTSIGDYAFEGCSGLTSVTFEAGSQLESIGGGAFEGCSGLTSVYYQGDLARWCEGFEGGYSLMKYCENLYINGELVQGDLVIPAGVTSIGHGAFRVCSGLTSVEIPASVTSIGSSAFEECSGLTSVTFEAGSQLESIGSYVFYGCIGLTSVEIPAGVTSIGDSAFDGCSKLSSVEIPASVTSIGNFAFSRCSGLTSVYYQGDLARWCEGFGDRHALMYYCENLYINGDLVQGDLVIPAGVTSIGYEAFSGCSGLTSVEIPASVTSIGVGAFSRCSGLTSVEIPAGVTSIGGAAFSGCSGLSSVEIPAGVTSIGIEAFYECSGLSSVEIPAGVTSIGYGAFRECSGLTSVTFGDTSGWYVTTSETDAANKTGGTAVFPSPTDFAANATLVRSTYYNYYWYKVD